MAAEKIDSAFATVARNSTAFFVWRVENLQLARVAKEDYGKFYSGDSYLIYSAFEPDQPLGVELLAMEPKGRMHRFIHFWLGSRTTQDEAGVAASKAIELDDYLGGYSIQQREMEGFESNRFLSYFSKGICVLPGGFLSQRKKLPAQFRPSLYSVKGKRTPIVHCLPSITWSLMNRGDVYVLEGEKYIFVWVGRQSNRQERFHGAKFAHSLKNQRRTECSVVIMEDDLEIGLREDERNAFNALLPLKEKKLQELSQVESDESYEKSLANEIKLYSVSDEGGVLKVTELKNGPLYQADLDSNESFIIDNGIRGVYAWIGRKASKVERSEALRLAHFFAKEKKYNFNTRILRVIDGSEPIEFKCLFRGWKDRDQTEGLGQPHSFGKIATVQPTDFAARMLYEAPKLAAESGMVDDGSGEKIVYRIINFELCPVPIKEQGKFYGSDCYVIRYTSRVDGKEQYIIYYWLGATSGQDERGAAAFKAVELDDALGGKAVQVRVVQGKEPKHFLAMFKGKMIIFTGGKASAFERKQGKRDQEVASTFLLHVHGNAFHNTKALEVPVRAASLNFNDAFVLVTLNKVYVWCGNGSTGDEREAAKQIALQYKPDPVIVQEGFEKAEFWELLGGKEQYWTVRDTDESSQIMPRLFHCSNATGKLKVQEILDFNQNDLDEDDVMILDAGQLIYIWIGENSRKDEVAQVEGLVNEYLKTDPKRRDLNMPVSKIWQRFEPLSFTGFFGAWNPNIWQNRFNFDQYVMELRRTNPTMTIAVSTKGQEINFYPLEVLREKDPQRLPKNVDVARKEDFLNDFEFEQSFKMSRQEFKSLKPWVQRNLKKEVGLF